MKMHHTPYLWLLLAIGMTGCGTEAKEAPPMPDTHLSSPLCMGRLLIDLPDDANPKLSTTFQFMETQPPKPATNFEEIKKRVAAQAKQFEASKVQLDSETVRFWSSDGSDPDKIFGKNMLVGFQTDESAKQAILSHLIKSDSPRTVTELRKYANGLQHIFHSEGIGADSYPKTRDTMWNAALHFQPLAHGEVPAAPGFCVASGMFPDSGKPPLREDFTLVTRFNDHPDARFVIDGFAIETIDKSEPSLKHRADSELRILRENVDGHVDVLVRGARKVADQDGYQIGLSVPNDTIPGTTAYKFFWSVEGVPNDASRPFMEVSLTIQPEDDHPASFTDAAQAQALWDTLLQSLRIRPGAVAR